MSNTPTNMDDVIDLRDVIERIEELEDELETACRESGTYSEDADIDCIDFDNWLSSQAVADNADAVELLSLRDFMDECKGNGGDEQWRGDWYPVTCVRDSHFEQYAQEFAEDIGAIEDNAQWPHTCIDWEQAAAELQMDYTAIEFDGVTYWVR